MRSLARAACRRAHGSSGPVSAALRLALWESWRLGVGEPSGAVRAARVVDVCVFTRREFCLEDTVGVPTNELLVR